MGPSVGSHMQPGSCAWVTPLSLSSNLATHPVLEGPYEAVASGVTEFLCTAAVGGGPLAERRAARLGHLQWGVRAGVLPHIHPCLLTHIGRTSCRTP